MKVLLFGGAGYIGTHVALAFMDRGDEVGIYDNLSSGLRSNVPDGAAFYEGDILDRARVAEVLSEGWDAAVHLAAFKAAGESMLKPEKYSENNITGSLIIMTECEKHGCMNFILSSSAATYGEPQYLPIDEKHPQEPINPYGMTKLIGEKILLDYEKAYGLHSCSFRYFNAAGCSHDGKLGEDHNPECHLIPLIIRAALNKNKVLKVFGNDYETRDGSCVRDFVHVEDLAEAHYLGLKYIMKQNVSEQFNLGSSDGFTVIEIINAFEKISGIKVPYEIAERRAGDPAVLVASNQKAKELLGWQLKRSSIENILKTALNWEQNKKY